MESIWAFPLVVISIGLAFSLVIGVLTGQISIQIKYDNTKKDK